MKNKLDPKLVFPDGVYSGVIARQLPEGSGWEGTVRVTKEICVALGYTSRNSHIIVATSLIRAYDLDWELQEQILKDTLKALEQL